MSRVNEAIHEHTTGSECQAIQAVHHDGIVAMIAEVECKPFGSDVLFEGLYEVTVSDPAYRAGRATQIHEQDVACHPMTFLGEYPRQRLVIEATFLGAVEQVDVQAVGQLDALQHGVDVVYFAE